ncbi:MAG: TetR family transcriptional regulator [Nevskia sp.]|nr:TetR family transcriptional regulator [Nevskia sp.]
MSAQPPKSGFLAAADEGARGAAATPSEAPSEALFRRVALELFAERGFHGSSLRDIAARAGTNVSHLYYYFPSKAHLLRSIMLSIVDSLLEALRKASAEAGDDPVARFQALVRCMVLFHAERQQEAFVGRSELRSLGDEARREVIVVFDEITRLFKDTLDAGLRSGAFRCAYPAEAIFSVLAMSSAVATWYRKGGVNSPTTIAERYARLALEMVGHDTRAEADGVGAAGS